MSEEEIINWQAVVEQLQAENEGLREKLTQAMKSTPLDEAVNSVIVLVQRTDPVKMYMYVLMACMIVFALTRIIELFLP
jgi:hypothetical protein